MSVQPGPSLSAPAVTSSPNPSTISSGSYLPQHKVRIVTATSLFDGHDASINIMRRILQAGGCEVIHLGHNRAVEDLVNTALQEDVQAIAVSSYQGGHIEYFKYLVDLLRQRGAAHVRVFGGGGGVIVPPEIRELEAYGVARIFSPEDGRLLGLQGMIDEIIKQADYDVRKHAAPHALARRLTELELGATAPAALATPRRVPVTGITGTGGAGKSSLTDEILRRFLVDFPDKRIAVLCVDPSKRKTGGALLGDRIRMNAIYHPALRDRVFLRSFATRAATHRATSVALTAAIAATKAEGYDWIIVETAGIGQSDSEVTDLVDHSVYVMTPEYGAPSQLEKIDMLDFADLIVLNKADKRGALDALRDVRKQVQRNRKAFDKKPEDLPVFLACANHFGDTRINQVYRNLINQLVDKCELDWKLPAIHEAKSKNQLPQIIPNQRVRYLAEIAEQVRIYRASAGEQAKHAELAFGLHLSLLALGEAAPAPGNLYAETQLQTGADTRSALLQELRAKYQSCLSQLPEASRRLIAEWPALAKRYSDAENVYVVRDKEIRVSNYTTSLSGSAIPKLALPRTRNWGDLLSFQLLENLPGKFPFTAGVFEYKRTEEDPTRMFAGEGTPEQTNRRFHYVSRGQPAARLSTAFDSVTLYGEDPAIRPDIYGKIGNSGVSICTLDDAKKLYSGFDLLSPSTSVSMTINGPAPSVLAFFLNAAIDQRAERWLAEQGLLEATQAKIDAQYAAAGLPRPRYAGKLPEGHNGLGLALLGTNAGEVLPPDVYARLQAEALSAVRGTVQADILKEDQAQNTCIFSSEFSLKVMGDIQASFVHNRVRNFYSVSVSGYHIAEAGANPISQLAFTLANGFTYVEYYLSRGMQIDDFAPNFSFFFSNGLDAEYSVIGRVARRIWAITLRERYGASERSQKLKYHIQTSGRSLHAQEIDFNDIRTTLQALYAIYDNCNSLHTNAYDEAVTTPTEESVRRAIAVQLIIARELGAAKTENPLQGSFIIQELTDLVEEAVLAEFCRISERGGVLGAMENMYQRGKIQEESLHYETLKHNGQLPLIGVNQFINPAPRELNLTALVRSGEAEKTQQIENLAAFQTKNQEQANLALQALRHVAEDDGNIFDALLHASKFCSLGQISQTLYEVGGQYRRNM